MKKILKLIIGDHREDRLEQRLFNTISFLNGIGNIGGSIATLSLANADFLFPLHVISGILFLVFWYYSRFHHKYDILYWPFIFLMLIFLSMNWLTNAGSMGGSHYYMIAALVIGIILDQRSKRHVLIFLLFILVSAGLFLLEEMKPELINTYTNMADQRFMDVMPNFLFVQLFAGVLVLTLSNNLNQERKKSDELLLNILPESIADELKKKETVTPRSYASATVLFTDFSGFTKVAEKMTAEQLINELDGAFRIFDRICKKHGLEKIKTIGDAYMAVGGIPETNDSHPMDCVNAGLEIMQFMNDIQAEKEKNGDTYWHCRLGIHTGPLVAGVIGDHKFAYDVWGDTVNTASRMESSGEIGKVNISSSTYDLIKDQFDCKHRGKIVAKNKGEIDMFFVERAV
ncbi:MAG: adenylate/guanylate cyclase domain-containing protein [Calditrichaeota bacterium]|nr:adenylate/guanylate cyclase domain-containing protein [Calditrichota bacterium]